MEEMPTQFVFGHLNVARAATCTELQSWLGADPIGAAGGYGRVEAHTWHVSDDEQARSRPDLARSRRDLGTRSRHAISARDLGHAK